MQISGALSPFEGSTFRYQKVESTQVDSIKDDVNSSASKDSLQKEEKSVEKKDSKNPNELTSSEKALVAKLQARDSVVRAHEAAHIAAGSGVVVGGASFTYQIGPDNKQYAIGGEVPIDSSPGKTPDETILKAQRIRAAALAPADPSPQDYKVAASASVMEARARAQKVREESQLANDPEKKREVIKEYMTVSG